jgi:hypothetical protein
MDLRTMREPFTTLSKLQFRAYYPHEIENLSVVHVNQTNTFDEVCDVLSMFIIQDFSLVIRLKMVFMMHEWVQQRRTIFARRAQCTAAVVLATLVIFNSTCPYSIRYCLTSSIRCVSRFVSFYQWFFQLLKGSCALCHRFTCDSSAIGVKLLLAELRCIDMGMISKAHSLDAIVRDRIQATTKSSKYDDNATDGKNTFFS